MSGHRQAVLSRWNSPWSRGARVRPKRGSSRSSRPRPKHCRWVRVFFTRGSATAQIRAAEDDRLEADFDKDGEKRVLNRFVEKA